MPTLTYLATIQALEEENAKLEAKLKIAEEALEFCAFPYANPALMPHAELLQKMEKARAALKEIRKP